MKNFFKLRLPKNPVKNLDYSNYWSNNSWQVETDVKKVLTEEILEYFSKLNLTPTLAVFFTIVSTQRNDGHHFAHTDLTLIDNEWKSVPFAINWELNENINTTVCWYDVSNCLKKMPSQDIKNKEYPFNYLNGAFYLGEKPVIEKVSLDTSKEYYPILFRTDVAHGVSGFTTDEDKRICFSLRFDIEQISSWDQATKIFKDYIIEDI